MPSGHLNTADGHLLARTNLFVQFRLHARKFSGPMLDLLFFLSSAQDLFGLTPVGESLFQFPMRSVQFGSLFNNLLMCLCLRLKLRFNLTEFVGAIIQSD